MAALGPEVSPGRAAPGDRAVAALQLEEDGDDLVRVGVEVEDGGAAAEELQRKGGETLRLHFTLHYTLTRPPMRFCMRKTK